MSSQIILEKGLRDRLIWIIKLRWVAIAGVFLVITVTRQIFGLKLPFTALYFGNAVLMIYNGFLHFYYHRLISQKSDPHRFRKMNRFAVLQISVDLVLLAYFIHFSGGIENPFIFYFIFHMVIASILLSNKAAYMQATFAIFLLGTVIVAEQTRILPHFHLTGFIPQENCLLNPTYNLGVFLIFASTLYMTVYMTTSIVNKLREGEKDLALANDKLKEQDRLKSQYVLTVSHDLQSSLSTIQSLLKVVLTNLTGEISEKSRELISRAEQRSTALLLFVRDLLNLSRIRASRDFKKTSIPFQDFVDKMIGQIELKAKEKRLKITESVSNHVSLYANPGAMEELFMNLLSNAVRYTPSGGKIEIQQGDTKNPGFVQVSISDSGIGIPEHDLGNVFKDFYRSDNAEAFEKNGTGLGLSIVKQIVDDHGGSIWVESNIGKGSKFSLLLPLDTTAEGG